MFGGSSQGQLQNDVWLFDLLKRQWSQLLPAQPDGYASWARALILNKRAATQCLELMHQPHVPHCKTWLAVMLQ